MHPHGLYTERALTWVSDHDTCQQSITGARRFGRFSRKRRSGAVGLVLAGAASLASRM
jgi:hypothetical protein